VKRLTWRRLLGALGALLGVLLGCVALGLMLGSSRIDLGAALSEWWDGEVRTRHGSILMVARLPHVVLASLVGAALATVGTVFQGLLRNPLADPYILGVSGGASVGVVGAVALGLGGTIAGLSALPLAAFAGALGSIALIYAVAAVLPGGVRGQHATYTLLLTGVVFNAFAMAVVLFLRSVMSPLDSQRTLLWLMGSLQAGRLTGAETWVVAACVGGGLLVLVSQARKLNLVALGDDAALSLGVSAARVRLQLFLASSLIVGAAVSAAGMVGFVGLVVPHSLRLLLGADHRLLVPASALGGAAFMVLADLLSRALAPVTVSLLPVGAVTAFVGVPLFFVFLVRDLRAQASR
jgi:iron complex transport system permease protein